MTGAPVLVDEAVLAQAADSEREIGEELAAALASPRDGRAIAEEFRSREAKRMSGRPNHSPTITHHTITE